MVFICSKPQRCTPCHTWERDLICGAGQGHTARARCFGQGPLKIETSWQKRADHVSKTSGKEARAMRSSMTSIAS